jgi:DEAD/DEAH box helicase domain-containing protein
MFLRLILACRETKEDPVAMLQRAGADHIPVNPSAPKASTSASTALTAEAGPSNVPSATARPSIVSIIGDLELQDSYRNQIVSRRVFDDRAARWGTLDRALSQNIVEALHVARGVTGFYMHQAEAINGFWQGRHVIVSTSTASGKSIIYQVCSIIRIPDPSL